LGGKFSRALSRRLALELVSKCNFLATPTAQGGTSWETDQHPNTFADVALGLRVGI
jgi:hypothetical protein